MCIRDSVRSAEDVDEVALSFAEVKMLATGDERFTEKINLLQKRKALYSKSRKTGGEGKEADVYKRQHRG